MIINLHYSKKYRYAMMKKSETKSYITIGIIFNLKIWCKDYVLKGGSEKMYQKNSCRRILSVTHCQNLAET